jgi:hypothetical protein
MKTLAWMSLVLTLLVGGDGLYMVMTHYQPKSVNSFNLSDGGTMIVAAVILLVVTIVAFLNAYLTKSHLSTNQKTTKIEGSR